MAWSGSRDSLAYFLGLIASNDSGLLLHMVPLW